MSHTRKVKLTEPLDLDVTGFAPGTALVINNAGDALTSVTLPANTVNTVKVSLTSAEILALNTTPKLVIAAPGVGKYIDVLSVVGKTTFGSVPYATNSNLNLIFSGGTNHIFQSTGTGGLLLSAVTRMCRFNFFGSGSGLSGASGASPMENTNLLIQVQTGNPTAGNSTIDVWVTYKVVSM